MEFKTPRGTASYAYVHKPQKAMDPGKPDQFSMTLIWDENEPRIQKLRDAIVEVAAKKFGAKAKQMLEKGQLRSPLRDGAEKEGTPGYEGKVFLTARSSDKPEVVDEDAEPIIDPMDFYSGCEARMLLWLFPYEKAGNRGVGAILNGVQKLGDGERISGRRPARDAFREDDEDLM